MSTTTMTYRHRDFLITATLHKIVSEDAQWFSTVTEVFEGRGGSAEWEDSEIGYATAAEAISAAVREVIETVDDDAE